MPDPYINDTQSPPVGSYVWEPRGPANGNYAAYGFSPLSIGRGEFRNDVPNCEAYPNADIQTSIVAGTRKSGEDSENWPFYTAFRPFAKPSITLPVAKGVLEIEATNNGELSYEIKFNGSANISAITIEYSLVFNPNDDSAKMYTANFDSQKLDQYCFAKVVGYTNSEDQGTEYPPLQNGIPSELQITDVSTNSSPLKRKTTIKFGDKSVSSNYPWLSHIRIQNRYNIKSLKLCIHKILLFNAKAVNLNVKQLPCKMLQYAFEFDYEYRPDAATPVTVIPSRANTNSPSIYIKVFDPEDTSGTIGFAHGINFYLQVFSLPIPGGMNSFSLGGVLTDMANPSWFMTTFMGPKPGVKNLRYALTAKPIVNSKYRVISLDQNTIDKNTTSLLLQKAVDYSGTAVPGSEVKWKDLVSYNLSDISVGGNMIREFLYKDEAKISDWYRIVEKTSSSQKPMMPFTSQIYSEGTVFVMTDSTTSSLKETVVRRVYLDTDNPPLKQEPLAIFIAQDGNPLADSVDFQKGPWKINIKAKSEDNNMYVNTHIFARFWFQPENSMINPTNPDEYRSQTEFCFKYENGTTKLTKGSPVSMDDVIVSPPLTDELTNYELCRYVDTFSDQRWTIPFANGVRANLVVALYSVSYLTPEGVKAGINPKTLNSPKVWLEINGQECYFETTISQTLSSRFMLRRVTNYDSSTFAPIGTLYLTKHRVGMDDISAPTGQQLVYDEQYSIDGNAFNGLLVLDTESGGNVNITIPIEEVSEKQDQSVFVNADFCTNGKSLANGRIEGGDSQDIWEFYLEKERIPIQDDTINADYSIEALLISSNGSIVERIFKTPLKPVTSTMNQQVEIDTSFLIGNIDSQLVIRFTIYPYSADGKPVNMDKLKEDTKLSVIGLKLKQFKVNKNTLSMLSITSSGYTGSPAFYENLPVAPNRSFGGQDLYLVVSPENLKTVITFPDIDWPVMGTLYGPTWFIDWKDKDGRLPESLEVQIQAVGFGDSLLEFRTVPTQQGAEQQETSISAGENKLTGNVDIVHDDNVDVSAQEVSAFESVQSFRRRPMDDPLTPSYINTSIAKLPNGAPIEGSNPALAYVENSSTFNSGNILGVIYDSFDGRNSLTKSVADPTYGVSGDFIIPNDAMQDIEYSKSGSLAKSLSNTILLQTPVGKLSYVLGWYNGYLIAKEVSMFDTPDAGYTYGGINYIIDGDASEELPSELICVKPNGSLNGKVKKTYPGVLFTNDNNIVVAYSLEGEDGIIYGRIGRCFGGFGPTQELVNLRKFGIAGSSSLTIQSPVLYNYEPTNVNYLAFSCGGKILVTCLTASNMGQGAILNPLYLVAGSKDFSNQANSSNAYFSFLAANNHLIVQREDNEDDVDPQKVGFLIGSKPPHTGALFVYYKDSKGKYKARRINDNGWVGEPVLI